MKLSRNGADPAPPALPDDRLEDVEDGGRPTLSVSQAVLRGDELGIRQQDIENALIDLRWHKLRKRRFSLHLPEPMESAWIKTRTEASIRMVQGAITLAFILYAVYYAFLYFAVGVGLDPILFLIFIVFGTPGNTVLMAASMHRPYWKYLQTITMAGTVWHTLGMGLFYARAEVAGIRIPTELLTAQIIFDLFLLSLRVSDSVKLVFLSMLVMPLAAQVATANTADAVGAVFFMSGVTLISLLGAYMAERVERISWLRQILLRFIAERDTLTSLLNHGAFFSRSERILRHAHRVEEPVAVITVDVDHFKKYNDTFGHPAGDDCLRRVARVIEATGRRPLDIAGRLGGEEFSLLLFGAAEKDVMARAEVLRNGIRELRKPDGSRITASLGVAFLDGSQIETVANLLSRADTALYQAKQGGRDRVVLAPGLPSTQEEPAAA